MEKRARLMLHSFLKRFALHFSYFVMVKLTRANLEIKFDFIYEIISYLISYRKKGSATYTGQLESYVFPFVLSRFFTTNFTLAFYFFIL